MLYSYAGFIEQKKCSFFKRKPSGTTLTPQTSVLVSPQMEAEPVTAQGVDKEEIQSSPGDNSTVYYQASLLQPGSPGIHINKDGHIKDSVKSVNQNTNIAATPDEPDLERTTRVKLNTMSNLSIV